MFEFLAALALAFALAAPGDPPLPGGGVTGDPPPPGSSTINATETPLVPPG